MPLVDADGVTQEFWDAAAKCRTYDDWQPLCAAVLREGTPSASEKAIAHNSRILALIKVDQAEHDQRRQAMNAEEREADDKENIEWLRRYYADEGRAIPWPLSDGRGTCCLALA